MQESQDSEENNSERLYTPEPGENQLTLRALVIGCLIGGIVTAMNIYIGLKIGWSFGASIMAAILGYAVIAPMPGKPYSRLENNITQTAGSSAGSMAAAAGFLAPIPALQMLGYQFPTLELFAWAIATAFLGVMFAVPLRRQYIEEEKLRFPSGTATAHTIQALYSASGTANRKARILLITALIAFSFKLLAFYFPIIEKPPIHSWLNSNVLTDLHSWGFLLMISPAMLGAGLLIGPRISTSILLGAITGWSIGYFVQNAGWINHPDPMVIHNSETDSWGPRGWILWPGVAIMVADAIMSLLLSYKTFIKAFQSAKKAFGKATQKHKDSIPALWWQGGLVLASCLTAFVVWQVFNIPVYLTIIAIFLSFILANVAVRATGETDINPIGGMGKVTQMVFGTLSSSIETNLLSAGITGAGATQAGDMMHDLKTGYMLGASPRKQFQAQLVGILSGIVCAVPVYKLFDTAYNIGGSDSELSAPAAQAWKGVARIMAQGFEALPPMSTEAMLIAAAFGALIPVLRKSSPALAPYLPSSMAFGLAFIIQAYYSIAIFTGGIIYLIWRWLDRSSFEALLFAVATGLVAGEGIGGIVNAVLMLF